MTASTATPQDLDVLGKIVARDASFISDHSPAAIHQMETLIRQRLATYDFVTGAPVATAAGLRQIS